MIPRLLFTLCIALLAIGYTARPASAQRTIPDRRVEDRERVLEEMREEESEQRARAAAWAQSRRLPISLRQQGGGRVQLVGLIDDRPLYLTSLNREAAEATGTLSLYPGQVLGLSLTGAGMEIGVWDGSLPRETHQEFAGRIVNLDQGEAEDHATHVAGTLAASGIRADARGMAYAATLRGYDWDGDVDEMTNEAERGLRISNHSYGVIAGWYYGDLEDDGDQWYWLGDPDVSTEEDYIFGWYDIEAVQFDRVTYSNPYLLPVVAAGNDRNDRGPSSGSYRALDGNGNWRTYSVSSSPRVRDGGNDGYDTVSGSAVAKNVLTVGSLGWTSGGELVASSFSSFGPVDDGRIKPDLMGYGERVISSISSGDAAYGISSGTSMATPNVAGSLALLQELAHAQKGRHLRAATLKGLALHTAIDLGRPGPDYQYGWGLLNTAAAAEHLREALGEEVRVMEAELQQNTTFTQPLTISEDGPLRVTISWTDYNSSRRSVRGASSLDDPSRHLRNDLDLRVTNEATGEVFMPFVLDPFQPEALAVPGDNVVDPIEQIYLPRVPAGDYRIEVTHKYDLIGGNVQAFALLVSGAEGPPQALSLSRLNIDGTVERVALEWDTQFIRRAGAFVILRAARDGFRESSSLGPYTTVGTLSSNDPSEVQQTHYFEDPRVPAGRYVYQIHFRDATSEFLVEEVEVAVPSPESVQIISNYPNPFQTSTRLTLDVPNNQHVNLEVFDLLGRRVQHVYDGDLTAGRHEFVVSASGWAPGVYFARLATPDGMKSHRMVIAR